MQCSHFHGRAAGYELSVDPGFRDLTVGHASRRALLPRVSPAELVHRSPWLPEEEEMPRQPWYVPGSHLSLQRADVETALTNTYCFPGSLLAY